MSYLYDYEIKNNKCILKKYYGFENHVVIPDVIEGIPVTEIDNKCFANNPDLIFVTIPESVTKIKKNAFFGCKELNKVNLPKKINSISSEAFTNCDNLTEIYLESQSINKDFFKICKSGVLVKVPWSSEGSNEWLSEIFPDIYLFNDPKNNIVFNYNNDLNRDGHQIFVMENGINYFINKNDEIVITHQEDYAYSLNEDLIIPSEIDGRKVTAIGNNAFSNAKFLSCILPETLKTVGEFAFTDAIFNYLRFPKYIEFLSSKSLVSADPIAYGVSRSLNIGEEDFSNYSNIVIMPTSIGNHDGKYYVTQFNELYEVKPLYNCDERKVINHEICYNKQNYMSYFIAEENNKKYVAILTAPLAQNIDNLPTSIDGVIVKVYDSYILNDLVRVCSKYKDGAKQYLEEHQDDDIDYEFFMKKYVIRNRLNSSLVIPDQIEKIKSYIGIVFSIEDTKVKLSPNVTTLEGISNYGSSYFVIPKTVKQYSNLSGNFFIEKGSRLQLNNDVYNDDIRFLESEIYHTGTYNYAIVKNQETSEKYAIIYGHIKNTRDFTLDSYINGYPIKEAKISFESNINTFTFNSEFYNEKKFNIDIDGMINRVIVAPYKPNITNIFDIVKFTYKKTSILEIAENVCSIKLSKKDYIDIIKEKNFLVYGDDYYNSLSEKEICDGFSWDAFDSYVDEIDYYKNSITVLLPKTLTYVSKFVFSERFIDDIFMYGNTVFDDSKVRRFVKKYPFESIQKIKNYSLSNVSVELMNQANELLENNYCKIKMSNSILVNWQVENVLDEEKCMQFIAKNGRKTTRNYGTALENGLHEFQTYISTTDKISYGCNCIIGIENEKRCQHVVASIIKLKEIFKNVR